ncbi:hypothetical protein BD626DRAFT_563755 [Schizophyllum amplum]|uniref:Uncharacterized protein n=1 Tax=Schizophyllum amplum TaxID=97359 RepID=A0A550CZ44_9AGAR|nr:hypothetical protein BD626DRAFT_563755 [Auriculariopsis ampla]
MTSSSVLIYPSGHAGPLLDTFREILHSLALVEKMPEAQQMIESYQLTLPDRQDHHYEDQPEPEHNQGPESEMEDEDRATNNPACAPGSSSAYTPTQPPDDPCTDQHDEQNGDSSREDTDLGPSDQLAVTVDPSLMRLLLDALAQPEGNMDGCVQTPNEPGEPNGTPDLHAGGAGDIVRHDMEQGDGVALSLDDPDMYDGLPAVHGATLFFISLTTAMDATRTFWSASPLVAASMSCHIALMSAIECNRVVADALAPALDSPSEFHIACGRIVSAQPAPVLRRIGLLGESSPLINVIRIGAAHQPGMLTCLTETELASYPALAGRTVMAMYIFCDSEEKPTPSVQPLAHVDSQSVNIQQAYLQSHFPYTIHEWAQYVSAGYGSAYTQQLLFRAVRDICNQVGIQIVPRVVPTTTITWDGHIFPLTMYDIAFWLGGRRPRTVQNIQTDRNKMLAARDILAAVIEAVDQQGEVVPELDMSHRMLKEVIDLILDDTVILGSPQHSMASMSQAARKAATMASSTLTQKAEDVRRSLLQH